MKSTFFICFLVFNLIFLTESRLTFNEYQELRKELTDLIHEKNCAPILVRLAWHDAGTYDHSTKTGGPRAAMRFETGESLHGANKGLDIARKLLAPIQEKYSNNKNPKISLSDLWALAGVVAIEYSGGPKIQYRFGRKDAFGVEHSVEEGRLPDGLKGLDHLRQVFHRMGFNDYDIVALSGAHKLGKCHADRSGFEGPWSIDPYKFDNTYFQDLLNKKWIPSQSSTGLLQYKSDNNDGTMMLSSDLALIKELDTLPIVKQFANNKDLFYESFSKAFQKLIELGYNDQDLYEIVPELDDNISDKEL